MRKAGFGVLLAIILTGCAQPDIRHPKWPSQSLSIEVCLHNNEVQVAIWEITKHGAGTPMILKIGQTRSEQSVQRSEISFFQSDKSILLEATNPNGEKRYYVIDLPLHVALAKEQWTAWSFPDYRAPWNPWMGLVNRKRGALDRYGLPLDKNAPQVRYLLHDFKNGTDWIRARRENGMEFNLPSC